MKIIHNDQVMELMGVLDYWTEPQERLNFLAHCMLEHSAGLEEQIEKKVNMV
jgi:hypothetical protein